MKYTPPRLHSLNGKKTRGNCGNGTAASAVSGDCTTGTGATAGMCSHGVGDGTGCQNGTAARTLGGALCNGGGQPSMTCGTGTGPFF